MLGATDPEAKRPKSLNMAEKKVPTLAEKNGDNITTQMAVDGKQYLSRHSDELNRRSHGSGLDVSLALFDSEVPR